MKMIVYPFNMLFLSFFDSLLQDESLECILTLASLAKDGRRRGIHTTRQDNDASIRISDLGSSHGFNTRLRDS